MCTGQKNVKISNSWPSASTLQKLVQLDMKKNINKCVDFGLGYLFIFSFFLGQNWLNTHIWFPKSYIDWPQPASDREGTKYQ